MTIGANYCVQHCQFRVWAPLRQQVEVEVMPPDSKTIAQTTPLIREAGGYWSVVLENVPPGSRYFYRLDGELRHPDPASQFQPEGVHGPSQVIDHSNHNWQDSGWGGIPLADYILYELHVGTFTPEGTFEAIIPRLPELKSLGITAIELMPIAQFPGDRNWGYDGVYPFAVQTSYGGPEGLKQLVDACHQLGLAVVLDVVYNHFGPEGNYTADFGPYLTERYATPWGAAINFDDAYSDGVRHWFLENVRYWLREYHMDGLRLDAVHAIYDFGARHILADIELSAQAVADSRGYPAYMIAESDLNDVRVIAPLDKGGYGIDAQWCDDFHHSLHTLLTNESQGYYQDFGGLDQLAKALEQSFVYNWAYSPHRHRYHGSDATVCSPQQFIICAQNHDQIGNRMLGERLSVLATFEALKLAAGTLLLSPYVPLLFMGEEYGETHPFLYFISHGDEALTQAVREGRKREFPDFHSLGEPPDAASLETFERCRLQWEQRHQGQHGLLWRFYQRLIQLRRDIPALGVGRRDRLSAEVLEPEGVICLHRWSPESQVLAMMNFQPIAVEVTPVIDGHWTKLLDSAAEEWMGPGSQASDLLHADSVSLMPYSFVLYQATP